MNLNERTENEQNRERTTTADLAGMGADRSGVATEQNYGGMGTTESSESTADQTGTEGNAGAFNGDGHPINGNGGNGANGMNRSDSGNGQAAGGMSATATAAEEAARTPLLQQTDTESLHGRWMDVQSNFVDDPRRAVQDADALVAELMQKLAKMFADERSKLEQEWDRGGEVSTEDLRTALRRYSSFFERLLSV
jgi:hypothetical protein